MISLCGASFDPIRVRRHILGEWTINVDARKEDVLHVVYEPVRSIRDLEAHRLGIFRYAFPRRMTILLSIHSAAPSSRRADDIAARKEA